MEYDIELTEDEVEYLSLKYLYEQKLLGRETVPVNEVFAYLDCLNDDHEADADRVLSINDDGIARFKSLFPRYFN
jgi:hypothetical protein